MENNNELINVSEVEQTKKSKREKKIKQPKPKKGFSSSTIKNFVKEVKRIKWPRAKKVWKWFGITILFCVLTAIFCFLVTLGFTSLFNGIGIKS